MTEGKERLDGRNQDEMFRLKLRDALEALRMERRAPKHRRLRLADIDKTATLMPGGIAREYRIGVRLGAAVSIAESDGERAVEHAKRHLEEMIIHEVYGDVLDELRSIRLALHEEGLYRCEATDRLDRLMDGLRPWPGEG